jgi:hypothetical protein
LLQEEKQELVKTNLELLKDKIDKKKQLFQKN